MKNERDSELLFKNLFESEFGLFIKVYWNGRLIFDDDLCNEQDLPKNYLKTHSGKEGLEYIKRQYCDRKIYSVYIHVVHVHHTLLFIEGEDFC